MTRLQPHTGAAAADRFGDLLRTLWEGGWAEEATAGLITAGLVNGSVDQQGHVEWADRDEAERLIRAAIAAFTPPAKAAQ